MSTSELARDANVLTAFSLQDNDKTILVSAGKKVQTHALIGSLAGIAFGAFLAVRLRQQRARLFQAFKTAEKPTHVRFANGREEAIPDITPLVRPSGLGDIAAYTFFSIAGLFVGGEAGFLTGSWSAKRTITSDPEAKARIEKAFRSFRADVLRKQIEELEKGDRGEETSMLFG